MSGTPARGVTAVGVCGFGRCGSSMVMRMLDAGGLPPVDGSSDRGYEHGGFSSLTAEELDGRAVKLLDSVLHDLIPPADVSWRFIWLDRHPYQQAKSLRKFMADVAGVRVSASAVKDLRDSFVRDRPIALERLRGMGEVLELRYESVLARPFMAADTIARFLDPAFDLCPAPMGIVVHERDWRCAPGLDFERGRLPA